MGVFLCQNPTFNINKIIRFRHSRATTRESRTIKQFSIDKEQIYLPGSSGRVRLMPHLPEDDDT